MGYWARSFRDAAHVWSLDDDDDDDEFLPTGENEDKLKHLWGDLGPIDAAGNFWRKFHFLSPEKLPDWLLCALLPRSPKFGHLLDNCTTLKKIYLLFLRNSGSIKLSKAAYLKKRQFINYRDIKSCFKHHYKFQQWLLEIETPGTMEHNLQEQFAKTDRTGGPPIFALHSSTKLLSECILCCLWPARVWWK